MSDPETLHERLRAVERTLTGEDRDLTDLRDAAELTRDLEALEDRTAELEARADELDAATQALRGYVGNVRAVNESVERRADAALAKAEALEDELRASKPDRPPGPETARTRTCECKCRPRRPKRRDTDAEDPESDSAGLLARIRAVLS